MSTKMTLDISAMQDDFFEGTSLIGIASSLPAYRFCWLLNHKFDLDLVRDPDSDLSVRVSKTETAYFPIYKYNVPLNGNSHLIYKLKLEKESLLPEIRQLDYLWMIQSTAPETEANEYTAHLRNLPEVQLAQILSPDRLKHLSHLLV